MLKRVVKWLVVSTLLISTGIGSDILVFTSDNSDGKITPKSIEESFKKAGYTIVVNRDMNLPFQKQFKESSFDIYNLFTLYKGDIVLELAKEYPNFGLFTPMSMSIYTKKGTKQISIASLTPETMAKIMGISKDNKSLLKLGASVKEVINSAMPNAKLEKLDYAVSTTTKPLVTTFEMEMDKDEWEDEKDEFQMSFESELKPNGFIKAGFTDISYLLDDGKNEDYDFYDIYSICKLPVIYTIAKTRPEAGAFAPCSMYMYKSKDKNMMNIAFPSVYNWISSLGITDKESLKVLEDAQAKIESIFKGIME